MSEAFLALNNGFVLTWDAMHGSNVQLLEAHEEVLGQGNCVGHSFGYQMVV